MISKQKKFVFVHIQKTAGNSIQRALEPFGEDAIVENPKQRKHNAELGAINRFGIKGAYINVGKHAKLSQIHQHWNTEALGDWNQYLKFTCVRNTWDRLVSLYFSPHFGRTKFDAQDFHRFIEDTASMSQSAFVMVDSRLGIDRFLRFEHLAEDFGELCAQLGIQATLPHLNQSVHAAYAQYYDPEARKLVEDLYAEEIEQFGFKFQS
ncbi:sulfotransferase family 2 domain-containing protein [uncultured Shimia sp.]|uniref:sulfotransferase family 2 domain-containing protein n=1 Tax=uncultured Shimia sp. TaxID=573152 RepID=UPI0025F58247|nr:sulfotransferase family 2 domain-containing protein [uncultured Shimia sp.]